MFASERLTSWPGRWTPLRISWQTRQQSPAPSLQSTPSRRRPPWRRESLRHLHFAPRWCTGTDAAKRRGKGHVLLVRGVQCNAVQIYTPLILINLNKAASQAVSQG